ncbi:MULTISPECIES: GNAT family N-acetyltransferase [Chromobacterium]|uniref:GNAT family N-acetyltransferase n=2 Tax=Chromobacterium TaxID=535 RepID=A0ABS3GGW3_9NEIS|nr:MULTISPECIES: GNAT family N-acetyltransferase [Chromobacterium]AXT46506.1 GNAT family N-acetyltransferase [Chromobacterium rhizoryzae]MBK0413183.1 GNAT family N-acetyltransferase [Chromobacterium haemolyticum]MBO0414285.1 GNAT family N-acetyltransferase [Chromobacterium haemolyticum]MBO0497856.1 GNAT family N-acetyltransferase [Chromobacterium haemolyticum]MDH0340162.1 GNAT family N-acetyltransferase [Chromobacterium haemolyticum]
MSIHIRPAQAQDAGLILRFIKELAVYERAGDQVAATEAGIVASLFGADSPARALICEVDGEPAGYAVYFFSYSTWQAKKGLYLEDLYISPLQRGGGAGKLMLRRLAQLAVEQGCGRFEWSVLDWNQPAIDFYLSIGAKPQAEWVRYRMDGAALSDFAAG